MSEFSESFHLRADDPQVVLNLLAAADLDGFVHPARGPLVAFVCEREGDSPDRLAAANHGVLVHYQYAEDHGCWVSVYDGPTQIARLAVSFEEERFGFDSQTFIDLGLLSPEDAGRLVRWVATGHDASARETAPDYAVAKALGLTRYAWYSYAYELDVAATPPGRLAHDRATLRPPPGPALEAPIVFAPPELATPAEAKEPTRAPKKPARSAVGKAPAKRAATTKARAKKRVAKVTAARPAKKAQAKKAAPKKAATKKPPARKAAARGAQARSTSKARKPTRSR